MDADDSFISQDSACAHTPKTAGDDLANSLLSFTTTPSELELQSVKRQKISRDPMSHRIIEKRRRDRMNNCLADLSRLIPTSYLKQGQGRIEKTEIIEMAIKHIRSLQAQVEGNQPQSFSATETTQDAGPSSETCRTAHSTCCREQFQHGFKECQNETLRYFVEGEAMVATDPFCMRVMEHLSTIAQQCGTHTLTDDKHGIQMELEAQQMTGSSTSFSSSSSSRNSILPLLPTPDGMVVPASPDKHLQNLLTTRALRQLEAERETAVPQSVNKVISCKASEVASLSSPPLETIATAWVSSPQPASSVSCDLAMPVVVKNCDNLNECISSGYMSDTSAMDRLSSGSSFSTGPGESVLTTKDNSVANVYKFKHNITKRFSLEGKIISQQCDGSSSTSSRETDEEHHHHNSIKYRSFKNKCRHASSSDSGPYPVSEVSGSTSTSSHDGIKGNFDRNKNRKVGSRSVGITDQAAVGTDCPRTSMPLPGFVLHPSGTHYMPMSVCYNSIPEVFDTGVETGLGPPVFHPISIPVHFRGPVISVPGSSLCSAGATLQHKNTKEAKTGQGS